MGRNSEGVGDAIEEGEHCCYIDGFRNLRLGPAMLMERLYVLGGGPISGFGDLLYIFEQRTVGRGEIGGVEIAISDGLNGLFIGSLNTQEVSMRVQSIRTAVQVRHPTRNPFLGLARQAGGAAHDESLTSRSIARDRQRGQARAWCPA